MKMMNWAFTKLTELKNEGGLKFCSVGLYNLLSKAEVFLKYVCDVLKPKAFQQLLCKFVETPVPVVGCDKHHVEFISQFEMDYFCKWF